MQWKACAIVWPLIAGCAVGAPPGFSSGDRWVFPLVGPLEEGLQIADIPVGRQRRVPQLVGVVGTEPDQSLGEFGSRAVQAGSA